MNTRTFSELYAHNKRATFEMKLESIHPQDALRVNGFDVEAWIDDAHLTLLHIGRLQDLRSELEQFLSLRISVEVYSEVLSGCFRDVLSHSRESTNVVIRRLTTVGVSGNLKLALEVPATAYLSSVRSYARSRFKDSLHAFGVATPEAFMSWSNVIAQHSPSWNPHITLQGSQDDLDSRFLSSPIEVRLGQPCVRGLGLMKP